MIQTTPRPERGIAFFRSMPTANAAGAATKDSVENASTRARL